MNLRPQRMTAMFSFEYPLPDLSAGAADWDEAEYEVTFWWDPGEPVTWDTPGTPPHWTDVEQVIQVRDCTLDFLSGEPLHGPDLSDGWDSRPWHQELIDALDAETEDLARDVPDSHRWRY